MKKTSRKNLLILNGSPLGSKGNCQKFIAKILKSLQGAARVKILHLVQTKDQKKAVAEIQNSDAVIFVTGTYWDSWGSPLQIFLENFTENEAADWLLGKPCAVFVLMHSVGGKSVLSRLQGVLSTLGFLIPPMSGMVYSLVSDLVFQSGRPGQSDDFWSLEDVDRILENLLKSTDIQIQWSKWPVDLKNFKKTWVK